jgi:tryptophan synthase alpha chain
VSRIAGCFARLADAHRAALIPYIAAGDPAPDQTVALMQALVRAGADIIELGVPFSDPMADGPVVQRASERALRHHVGLADVLAMVTRFRASDSATPVVLMGYANPIERFGVDAFAHAAQAAGVDGVLVVDYPPEECALFASALRALAIDPIFLLAPTTSRTRVRAIARQASGYVYYVALKGTTGAKHFDIDEVRAKLPELREDIRIPIGVGFGIRDAASAAAVAAIADAVVIGSRIIEEIERASTGSAVDAVEALVSQLRAAVGAVHAPLRHAV